MHALIGRFFERVDRIVEGYGGTIDKHIGDCVMAVFGAPRRPRQRPGTRDPRSARDPGRDAGAKPEFGREISVHIGIASGQVVASSGRRPSHGIR